MKKKSLPASDRPSRDGSLGGVIITVLVAITVLTISCNNTPTEPERRIKTPREMAWTADTLPVPEDAIQVLPEDLLVLSPTDIYLATWVGHGVIMHYNGSTWTKVLDSGGIDCLAGTTAEDLWAGGYTGNPDGEVLISHYNGVQWKNVSTGVKGELLDMTQDPEGNLWACGRNGVILKYDKTKWIADTITVGYLKLYPGTQYLLRSVEYYNGSIYALGSIFDFNRSRDIYYLFSGEINSWVLKDSMVIDSPSSNLRWGYFGLYKSDDNILYSYGGLGIWKKTNQGWEKMFDLNGEVYGMYGISSNYIIAVSAFKRIYFYNGSSWESISDLFNVADPNFVFQNIWSNGYETTVVGYGVVNGIQKTIVWHGK